MNEYKVTRDGLGWGIIRPDGTWTVDRFDYRSEAQAWADRLSERNTGLAVFDRYLTGDDHR